MSEPTNELETVADVIAKIPSHWRNATIFMSCGIGGVVPIRRVSLQRQSDGRRVVLIHQDNINPHV